MAFVIKRVDVWVCEVEDHPGRLADKLEAVMRAGANLDFIIARPEDDKPRLSVLFVAPVEGAAEVAAAEEVGLCRSTMHALRVEGPDRPGLAAGIARTLSEEGINIVGLSAAGVRDGALLYIRFLNEADVVRAARLLTERLG